MQYTEEDQQILHDTWMSYKAKMRVTQIEMAKKLGMSQFGFFRYSTRETAFRA